MQYILTTQEMESFVPRRLYEHALLKESEKTDRLMDFIEAIQVLPGDMQDTFMSRLTELAVKRSKIGEANAD